MPETRLLVLDARKSVDVLSSILETVRYYEEKVTEGSTRRTAKEAMRVVAKEMEANGLHGVRGGQESEPT